MLFYGPVWSCIAAYCRIGSGMVLYGPTRPHISVLSVMSDRLLYGLVCSRLAFGHGYSIHYIITIFDGSVCTEMFKCTY